MRRIAILLALLLCLSACGQRDQEITVTPDSQSAGADAAQTAEDAQPTEESEAEATEAAEETQSEAAATEAVQPLTVTVQQVESTASADDGTEVLHTNYPTFAVTGGSAAGAIADDLMETATVVMDDFAHGYGGESESLEAEAREAYESSKTDSWDWQAPYTHELTAAVVRSDEGVVSVVFTDYTYAGGVHGFYYSFGRCYDAQTGERLTLENIANQGVNLKEKALAIVEEMSKNPELYDQTMFFEGYEDSLPDVVGDDFLLDEKGLTFSAAPYALASYASGEIDFTIPYDQLTALVQEQYLK